MDDNGVFTDPRALVAWFWTVLFLALVPVCAVLIKPVLGHTES